MRPLSGRLAQAAWACWVLRSTIGIGGGEAKVASAPAKQATQQVGTGIFDQFGKKAIGGYTAEEIGRHFAGTPGAVAGGIAGAAGTGQLLKWLMTE